MKIVKIVKRIVLVVAGLFALLTVIVIIGVALRTPEQRAADERKAAEQQAEFDAGRKAREQRDADERKAAVAQQAESDAARKAREEQRTQPAAPAPAKNILAERGGTYKAAAAMVGPVALADRDEVVKAIQYDKQGLLELIGRNRARMLNQGETVLVTDRDVSILNGSWVEVRVTEGLAKGKFWVPQWVLAGLEHTKP